jgi:hypothetical protein
LLNRATEPRRHGVEEVQILLRVSVSPWRVSVTPREDLAQRCETIERAYEFMLAYAAQGLSGDAGSQSGGELRELLSRAAAALSNLSDQYAALVDGDRLEPRDKYSDFIDVIRRDAADALAAIELVLAQRSISSQVVDNLNASIHVRALLTDLFLIDEILKTPAVDVRHASNP